jgi:anti-sigma factor RsiW
LAHDRLLKWLNQVYTTTEAEIDCDQLQAMLPAYVEFELSGSDGAEAEERAAKVRAHLAQCPDCAEEYQGLKAAVALEAQGRLPSAEESLAKFEAETGAPVPHTK